MALCRRHPVEVAIRKHKVQCGGGPSRRFEKGSGAWWYAAEPDGPGPVRPAAPVAPGSCDRGAVEGD
eukprot:11225283-Lingulodinium_polyedra.AAC.1